MENNSYPKDKVIEIVQTLAQRVNLNRPYDTELVKNIEFLKSTIEDLQKEFTDLHSPQMHDHIPDAKMELDAIVDTTENATNTIMEACEAIQENLAGKPLEETAYIDSQLIRIVEACTFQDLTGQRISKISKFLKEIDERVSLLDDIIENTFPHLKNEKEKSPPDNQDSLLNGPSLAGQGISQDEIDKLLNEF